MGMGALFSSVVVELVEEDKTDHVDNESNDRNCDQPIVVDLDRREDPLHALAEYIVRYENQEDAVEEPTDSLNLAITVSVFVVRFRELSNV